MAQIVPKVAQTAATIAFLLISDAFQSRPKSCQIFGLLLQELSKVAQSSLTDSMFR